MQCIKLAGGTIFSNLRMCLCSDIDMVFLHTHSYMKDTSNNHKCYHVNIGTVIMDNCYKILKGKWLTDLSQETYNFIWNQKII